MEAFKASSRIEQPLEIDHDVAFGNRSKKIWVGVGSVALISK